MEWFGRPEDRPPSAPKGPVTWGLAGGVLGIASLLLAVFSPVLLAVGVLIVSSTAAGMAAGVLEEAAAGRRKRRMREEAPLPDVVLESNHDGISEKMNLEVEAGSRFQERLSNISPPASRRLHESNIGSGRGISVGDAARRGR